MNDPHPIRSKRVFATAGWVGLLAEAALLGIILLCGCGDGSPPESYLSPCLTGGAPYDTCEDYCRSQGTICVDTSGTVPYGCSDEVFFMTFFPEAANPGDTDQGATRWGFSGNACNYGPERTIETATSCDAPLLASVYPDSVVRSASCCCAL